MVLENKLFGTPVSENMVWEFRFQNIRFWKTWFSKEGFVQKDDCQSHVCQSHVCTAIREVHKSLLVLYLLLMTMTVLDTF